jgi:hypothetical protein
LNATGQLLSELNQEGAEVNQVGRDRGHQTAGLGIGAHPAASWFLIGASSGWVLNGGSLGALSTAPPARFPSIGAVMARP